MKKHLIHQPIPYPLFLFISFVFTALFSSCETENNPKADAYIDKQQIVYNAEIRTDLIVWNVDIENEKVIIPNNGLDDLFLPFPQQSPTDIKSQKNLKFYIDQAGISQAEQENVTGALSLYHKRQSEVIALTQELIDYQLDSLKRYKIVLLDRLNGGTLTQVQYDQLLTNSKETFIKTLRHSYNESKILIASAQNLIEVLSELELKFSKKSWDRLVSLVKK